MQKVAIIGASPNHERYAYKAMQMLLQYGHQINLISPRYKTIDKYPVHARLADINKRVDTVTVYIGADKQSVLIDDILKMRPGRVIFNPGTENEQAYQKLIKANIAFEQACTLVLLQTGQFE